MEESTWYLRKSHDGSQFGPIPFSQLQQWAADAQVSPLDRVSTDEKTWMKAPMVPELEMDYLIQLGEDQYYGPTTVGAIREFLNAGEITHETSLTNCKDATQLHVKDLIPVPRELNEELQNSDLSLAGTRGSIRINLQQRIRELEEALLEERRARETAEMLVEKLEMQIANLTKK
jgi:hypothetical protein